MSMSNLKIYTMMFSVHVSPIDTKAFVIFHGRKSICYFLQFLPFDLELSELDLGQGHLNQMLG